ncbi:MAG: hypothetical protein ACM3KR_08605 [Deltaproteobacteria bacterium]
MKTGYIPGGNPLILSHENPQKIDEANKTEFSKQGSQSFKEILRGKTKPKKKIK